ncbi:MAG TPA: N-acetyltransferase [Jatrophihabitantaceae bacterium]|nr:N-acetyltransferase [Jatrophihabitantaceae bacterium]
MSIDVRPQTDDDVVAVRRVITEAFGDDGQVADLAEALRARSDMQASLVAVAAQRQVVGHTHLSISWVDAPSRLIEVLTLSPLAVAPSHQSQGVGTRLLHEAIRSAKALGVPLVFLEGNPAYYSRHGWSAAADLGFHPPSSRIPAPGFQVATLETYEPASMTGALVYNDTFWTHDRVGLRS